MMTRSLPVIPTDRFLVRRERMLLPEEERVLSLLYQPLVGGEGIALYHGLNQLIPIGRQYSDEGILRWFPPLFQYSWSQFIEAKEQLEAVGLLRTLYRSVGGPDPFARSGQEEEQFHGDHLFHYHLQLPLSAAQFFKSDVLSTMLLNRTGKSLFRVLRKQFQVEARGREAGKLVDVTKRFDEVFTSVRPSEMMLLSQSETAQFFQALEVEAPVQDPVQKERPKLKEGVQVIASTLDLEAVYAMLPSFCQPKEGFTPTEVQLFHELAFFYQLDEMQLVHFLQEPLLYDERGLDLERLRQQVRTWYQKYYQREGPLVVSKKQLEARQQDQAEQKGDGVKEIASHEEYQVYLEQFSPIKLLESHQQGAKVSSGDLKIIQNLLHEYQLPVGVINVLLEYVMYTHDHQLPAPLIYKIAAHWKRLGIASAAEAMNKAKEIHRIQQEQRKANTGATRRGSKEMGGKGADVKRSSWKKNYGGSVTRPEVKPAWLRQMEEEQQQRESHSGPHVGTDPTEKRLDPAEEKEILELLHALGELD